MVTKYTNLTGSLTCYVVLCFPRVTIILHSTFPANPKDQDCLVRVVIKGPKCCHIILIRRPGSNLIHNYKQTHWLHTKSSQIAQSHLHNLFSLQPSHSIIQLIMGCYFCSTTRVSSSTNHVLFDLSNQYPVSLHQPSIITTILIHTISSYHVRQRMKIFGCNL